MVASLFSFFCIIDGLVDECLDGLIEAFFSIHSAVFFFSLNMFFFPCFCMSLGFLHRFPARSVSIESEDLIKPMMRGSFAAQSFPVDSPSIINEPDDQKVQESSSSNCRAQFS